MVSTFQEGKKGKKGGSTSCRWLPPPPSPHYQRKTLLEASCRCFLMSHWSEMYNVLLPKPVTGKPYEPT